MIKVRGGLLFHSYRARGALLQQQAEPRSFWLSSECSHSPFSLSSHKNPLSCRCFRGPLPSCGREHKFRACPTLRACSKDALKRHSILARWSFQNGNLLCQDVPKFGEFLHTSSRGKLTTSELIKRVQLAKSTESRPATAIKAPVAFDFSVEKSSLAEEKEAPVASHVSIENTSLAEEKQNGMKDNIPSQGVKPFSEKPSKGGLVDRRAGMMPISKLIPPHVVDRGFVKKELFSKQQALQSNPRQQVMEVLQKGRQTGPNQRQNLPVLQLLDLRKDTIDEPSRVQVSNGRKKNRSGPAKALDMSTPGRTVAAERLVKPSGLLTAGFGIVSDNSKADGTHPRFAAERHLQPGESTTVASNQHIKAREFWVGLESASFTRESYTSEGKAQLATSIRSMEGQTQQPTEREGIAGGRDFFGSKSKAVSKPVEPLESRTLPGSRNLANHRATSMHLAQQGKLTAVAAESHDYNRENSGKEPEECSGALASQRCAHVQAHKLTESGTTGHGKYLVGGAFPVKQLERPRDMGVSGQGCTKASSNETAHKESVLDDVRQHQQNGEGTNGKQPFLRQKRDFLWPQGSTRSAGENREIIGEQPFHRKMPGGTQFERFHEEMDTASRQSFNRIQSTDPQFQAPREDHAADRLSGNLQAQRPSEGQQLTSRQSIYRRQAMDGEHSGIFRESEIGLPLNSTPAAPTKPYDRNRPRRKYKNELKEKDLSVQPIVGEPHYEYILRRKRVRAEAQKALVDDVDDYTQVGDDWVRKRLGWLCKEIPVMKASGLVKMLNNQRKWIKQEHLVELIEHLVRYMELNRAHRVLKWMQQQPLYVFEFDIHNNMAYILGRNDKLSRCQDVFDEIVRNGKFPDNSVFTALIKAYLNKGDQGDINDAWKLYNQMLQLGLTTSPSLCEMLLKSLTCPSGRWIRQAEELLVKMRASEIYISEEMYTRVIDIYGNRGDHKKVEGLIAEMKKEHLEIDINVMNASLAACVKDGDAKRAEEVYMQIISLGLKSNWHTFAYLIQVYGKAQVPTVAWEVFQKMKGTGISINFVTYHAIIEAMAKVGLHVEQVMQVLTEVEDSGIKPLQPCYNSVMSMYLNLKKYDDVESIFYRGKAAKVRPGHAAYNMLLKAYTEGGQLEKAEAVFQEMKATEGMGPNAHTYNILLEGYGVGCFKPRVRELFEEMSAKGCQLDPEVKAKIISMVSVKKIAELDKKKLLLTDEQREIIPGLLLGGAKMESPDKNRTYELHLEFNCENQVSKIVKDHLSFQFQAWWKQNALASSAGKCEDASEEARAVESLTRLETVSHGSLRFYAHQYRPNGEPVIPKLIHRWLKPRTLAYWYMYGGRKCRTTGGIVLNTSKYSGKQIQLVVKALKARTMDCRRRKRRNGDAIRFEGKSALWLWKLMEPHILKAAREHLKPEEIPVNLDVVEGKKPWESREQGSSDDEDDWDDLDAEKDAVVECA